MSSKDFHTLAARFALLGWSLAAVASDAGTRYHIARHMEAFVLSHPNDVAALLRQLESGR